MRRALLALLVLVGIAHANGRPSATSTINFKPGDPREIAAGLTFGMVLSHDGGATWHWMCEKAVGYGGLWDPDYAYTASGALFATTFGGLKVMRDGCVFGAAPPGTTFVSQVEVAPGGDIFYAASDPHDGNIYRSNDDGVTFTSSTAPGRPDDWWQSLKFSTANPQRAYLAGYRFQSHCLRGTVGAGDDCVTNADCPRIDPTEVPAAATCGDAQKVLLLARSDDGGTTFAAQLKLGLPPPTSQSELSIVGIDASDPDIVYAKLHEQATDTFYVSLDGAQTWTQILQEHELAAFVARASGEIVVATKLSGAQHSLDHGATWTALANPPHIGCLTEDAAGTVWACTQNYAQAMAPGIPAIPADGYGIMTTRDLVTWTGVMRYQDIDAVSCPAGTAQHDQCVEKDDGMPSIWCCLAMQMGITNPGADCSGRLSCIPGADDTPIRDVTKAPPPPHGGGCCDAQGAGASPMGMLGAVILVMLRRRRR